MRTSLYPGARSRDASEGPSGNACRAAALALSVQWRTDSVSSAARQESPLNSAEHFSAFWACSKRLFLLLLLYGRGWHLVVLIFLDWHPLLLLG